MISCIPVCIPDPLPPSPFLKRTLQGSVAAQGVREILRHSHPGIQTRYPTRPQLGDPGLCSHLIRSHPEMARVMSPDLFLALGTPILYGLWSHISSSLYDTPVSMLPGACLEEGSRWLCRSSQGVLVFPLCALADCSLCLRPIVSCSTSDPQVRLLELCMLYNVCFFFVVNVCNKKLTPLCIFFCGNC